MSTPQGADASMRSSTRPARGFAGCNRRTVECDEGSCIARALRCGEDLWTSRVRHSNLRISVSALSSPQASGLMPDSSSGVAIRRSGPLAIRLVMGAPPQPTGPRSPLYVRCCRHQGGARRLSVRNSALSRHAWLQSASSRPEKRRGESVDRSMRIVCALSPGTGSVAQLCCLLRPLSLCARRPRRQETRPRLRQCGGGGLSLVRSAGRS
ncbi:hypothetical protein FKP32DRAFT_1593918 [Trametes sanguinea]|nr:hypothetical protein FKP32DRAFT_1593918 [Trametes sanguinea]